MDRIPLEDLCLPQLYYGALRRAGLMWVDELQRMSDEELATVRRIGEKGVRVIRERCLGLGKGLHGKPG